MEKIHKRFRHMLALLGIFLLTFVIYLDLYYLKKSLRPKEIPETVHIINETKYDVDFKTKLIINRIFGYDSIYIKYDYMIEPKFIDGNEVTAHVIKDPMFDNHYIIYMSKKIKKYNEDIVLSHELIHIDQYEKNDLEMINVFNWTFRYKDDTISLIMTPYNQRLFEIDAYNLEDSVYNQLQTLIKEYK